MAAPVPLINRIETQRVLERAGVAALVVAEPINIYHATGFWPQTAEMGHLGTSVALVPADPAEPVTLVTAQFLHYFFDFGPLDDESALRVFLYTAPDDSGEGAAPPMFFRSAPDGAPDPYERAARGVTSGLLETRPAAAGAHVALRDALATSKITGPIATDGVVADAVLGDGPASRPAAPLLRHIRMVKSPPEIALMRVAARNNAEAAAAAIRSVGPGDSYETLRRAFFAETGRRDGHPVFLSTDHSAYRKRDGIIRPGRCFSIDAVASYARYHGDYGRTIFVGEPQDAQKRAIAASIRGNETVARELRPGLLYSDVTRIARAAIADAGFDVLTPAAPHSVGLYHTDEAFAGDALTFAKADHRIVPNMVLSVDMPILQTDMGGSVHLEDLWLITEDGCEPLNDTADPFYQI